MKKTDTIIASATPPGSSAIGVVRLSGPSAATIIDRVISYKHGTGTKSFKSHTVHYGTLLYNGVPIDQVLVTVMFAPNSYTGEDVVEVSCHGNMEVVKRLLRICIDHGARLAEPGEFTKRAFLNGKIGLLQAEAVMELIEAKSDRALVAAASQLAGRLEKRIKEVRDSLIGIGADLEARIDFPDEELECASLEAIARRIEHQIAVCMGLCDTYAQGTAIKTGLYVAFTGKVNVGKSSLFNRLMGEDRAIVTDERGTTRDIVEGRLALNGNALVLVDTAGMDGHDGAAAAEAIKRSREAVKKADIVILVGDASNRDTFDRRNCFERDTWQKAIVVCNKADKAAGNGRHYREILPDACPFVEVSAKTGQGIDVLRTAITERVESLVGNVSEEALHVNYRQYVALQDAVSELRNATRAYGEGFGEEVMALELGHAIRSVSALLGIDLHDEVIHKIFDTFCIGK
jgi:tRNA modification GTPase